jgi:hypothetical protein
MGNRWQRWHCQAWQARFSIKRTIVLFLHQTRTNASNLCGLPKKIHKMPRKMLDLAEQRFAALQQNAASTHGLDAHRHPTLQQTK